METTMRVIRVAVYENDQENIATQPGAKKLQKQCGSDLVCVRYGNDREQGVKLETIELIVDSRPMEADTKKIPGNRIVNTKIEVDELASRRRVKTAGGKWDPKRRIWQLPYEKVTALGLSDRIFDTQPS